MPVYFVAPHSSRAFFQVFAIPYGKRQRGLWIRGFHEPDLTIALVIFAVISFARTQSCGYTYAWEAGK